MWKLALSMFLGGDFKHRNSRIYWTNPSAFRNGRWQERKCIKTLICLICATLDNQIFFFNEETGIFFFGGKKILNPLLFMAGKAVSIEQSIHSFKTKKYIFRFLADFSL